MGFYNNLQGPLYFLYLLCLSSLFVMCNLFYLFFSFYSFLLIYIFVDLAKGLLAFHWYFVLSVSIPFTYTPVSIMSFLCLLGTGLVGVFLRF